MISPPPLLCTNQDGNVHQCRPITYPRSGNVEAAAQKRREERMTAKKKISVPGSARESGRKKAWLLAVPRPALANTTITPLLQHNAKLKTTGKTHPVTFLTSAAQILASRIPSVRPTQRRFSSTQCSTSAQNMTWGKIPKSLVELDSSTRTYAV